MKNGDKVVCIDGGNERFGQYKTPLIVGEIYTVAGLSISGDGYYYLKEIPTISGITVSFCPALFRPVDDTFGEVVAEIIEKQVEVEQMETV